MFKKNLLFSKKVPIILVANKADLEAQRQVPTTNGKELATKLGALFIETSAKNNVNVSEAFCELVRKIDNWRATHPDETASPGAPKKKKSCSLL